MITKKFWLSIKPTSQHDACWYIFERLGIGLILDSILVAHDSDSPSGTCHQWNGRPWQDSIIACSSNDGTLWNARKHWLFIKHFIIFHNSFHEKLDIITFSGNDSFLHTLIFISNKRFVFSWIQRKQKYTRITVKIRNVNNNYYTSFLRW